MTGIAEIYLCLRNPHSKDARTRLKALFDLRRTKCSHTCFVVLSWKRTGSNLLCGILHHHPEIVQHNELFNQIDIFSYHPKSLLRNEAGDTWSTLGRDLYPEAFLEHFWSGTQYVGGQLEPINESFKAVGFKSFPDHWTDVRNEDVWQKCIMDDVRIKKIILHREDELAVYLSMMRAEKTGRYMTLQYPKHLKLSIDPARFQAFVNNYRDTFRRKYRSAFEKQDSFRVSYEQLIDEQKFEADILPLLWEFLGVDTTVPLHKLRETVKQADPNESPSSVIENYDQLEFCFRHTDVLHFSKRFEESRIGGTETVEQYCEDGQHDVENDDTLATWSILLPICSRGKSSEVQLDDLKKATETFNSNRLIELTTSSQYHPALRVDENRCWGMLENFAMSLRATATTGQMEVTECIVGVDVDDSVFHSEAAFERIRSTLSPCNVVFVDILPAMYGRVCRM